MNGLIFVWVNVKQIFTSPMDPIIYNDTLPFEVPFLFCFSSLFFCFRVFFVLQGRNNKLNSEWHRSASIADVSRIPSHSPGELDETIKTGGKIFVFWDSFGWHLCVEDISDRTRAPFFKQMVKNIYPNTDNVTWCDDRVMERPNRCLVAGSSRRFF